MALRIKVDGSGSTQPKLLASVNNPNDFGVPGWRPANDWVAPCIPDEETGEGGVNFASVSRGYPVWDGSRIHTTSGAMSLQEFFELHNIPEADQTYFRQQLDNAYNAAMATPSGQGDAAFVNCQPWWNARCACVKRGTGGKLPVVGRTLRLRVRPSFYGVGVYVKPTPMTIESTFSFRLEKAYGAARVVVKKPNVYSPAPFTSGWLFDTTDEIVKDGEENIPVVTAWQDTIDKIAFIQCRQSSMLATCAGIESTDERYTLNDLTDTPANDLKQIPFFSAHPEVWPMLNRVYPPALTGEHALWLPGIYFGSTGEVIFVRLTAYPGTGFPESSDYDEDIEIGGRVLRSGVSATAPNGIDVNLDEWHGRWGDPRNPTLRPADHGPTQGASLECPVCFSAGWHPGNGTGSAKVTIRIKTGNKGNRVSGADKIYLSFFGYPIQYGDGTHYTAAYPTDGTSPRPESYTTSEDSGGHHIISTEIPLDEVLTKTSADGEERWDAGQDVTLSYYIGLDDIIATSPGAFHCGFSAGTVAWPKATSAASYSPGPYDLSVKKYDSVL